MIGELWFVDGTAPTTICSVFALGTVLGFSVGYYYWRFRFTSRDKGNSSPEDSSDEDPAAGDQAIYESTTSNKTVRMIIGVRNDLKMGKGKVAAQVAHAAVASYVKAAMRTPKVLHKWSRQGQAKITVRLDSETEMEELAAEARAAGILVSIIRDAGHTQVEPNTRTVIAFGPAPKDELDKVTGHLKLY